MMPHSSQSQKRQSRLGRRARMAKRHSPLAVGVEPLELRVLMSGSVLATVANDLNGNGINDPAEPPLGGWTVFVDTNRNGVLDASEPSQITDINGEATITGISNGKADIREIIPDGWFPSTGSSEVQRVNISNNKTTNVLFLNMQSTSFGSASGTVWNDINGDGIRAVSDPGIPGWTVFADLNANKVRDPSEPFAITNASGVYTIPGLTPGKYKIREITPTGWDPTIGFDGQNSVDVVAGKTAVSDFGNFNVASLGSIQGTIWNDVNADGVRAAGDPGLGGWTVFLDLNLDGVPNAGELTALTDAGGAYSFPSVVVGNYRVSEVLQDGWNPSPGHPINVDVTVVNEGTARTDFANFTPTLGSISGKVWNDLNGDGILSAEPGLSGWTVFIDQNSDGIANVGEPSAVTDASGVYKLLDVAVGSSVVREIPPVGWTPTAPGTGMQLVVVHNATDVSGVNFGNKQRTDGAISGIVYFDANHSAARDAGESTLAGITVYLDTNNNGALDPSEPSAVSSADLFYTPAVDETGTYSFSHLPTGTYHVREIIPAVLSSTPAAAGEQVVDLAVGEDRRNVNFADVFRPNEIHGMVFDDLNKNNVRDAGEAGLSGVTLYLDRNRNNIYEASEPKTISGADGTYSFVTALTPGSYVVRELRHSGREHSYPTTTGGILWPSGVSNPAIGNVTPTSITTSLAEGQVEHDHVSLTLPGSGALSNMVDVFLLFDDTGSFTANSPIVRAALPQIISALKTAMPTVDFGFGVGRFEEYANFASEFATGRPFILNQPIVAASTPGFSLAIQSALDRTAPGYGGDTPETDIEALFQTATGRGFDGNNNGTTSDSGAAGMVSTQLTPGASGDVPSFGSFTVDAAGNVLPAAGTVGGAGFRAGALPIILLATDTGLAFQPAGETSITGLNGLTLPISALTQTSRPTTPFASGAGIQETVTALNALGALVIGLGTNGTATVDPRQDLEALAKLTGATNQSLTTIPNGTLDPIAPGDPFYFQISSGFGASVANGIVSAIENGASNVAVNVTVKASDPHVHVLSTPGVVNNLGAGQTAAFDVTFTGDGKPHRFDLQFVRQGTDVVLGSIPVVIGTPIVGDGYEYEDLEDGEITQLDDFGSWVNPLLLTNVAPTFTKGADQTATPDGSATSVPGWASRMSTGSAGETDQLLDFVVSTENYALFSAQPAIAPDGTLTYMPVPGAVGAATITVRLHDSGGSVGGGADTSAAQTFTITLPPPAPLTITTHFDAVTREALVIDLSADVATSLLTPALQLVNLATNLPASLPPFEYDATLHRVTIFFSPLALPNGDYRLTISAGALPGLTTPYQFDFFILSGDVNRDRTVGFADLVVIAQNYDRTGVTHAQGDLTGDGAVSFADLVLVAQNYDATLTAPSPAPVPAAALSPSSARVLAPVVPPSPVASVVVSPVSSPIFSRRTPPRIATPSRVTHKTTRSPAPVKRPAAALSAFSTTRIKRKDTVGE